MDELGAAALLAEAARRTVALGLNRGAEGNVSLRFGEGFLITPSGLPNDSLQAGQMVYMDLDGGWRGPLKPSSEWRIHRDIYRARPEAQAVVHAHSPHAVSLACLRRPIPAFHYMVAAAGGHDIPCAAYATFGTEALSANVLTALAGRRACLMANHGQVALGRTLEEALRLAEIVEELAAQYWRARLLGEPVLLTEAEMDAVLERFAGYGQAPAGG
ncbi:MAG: class II aldolase/adducin family protein [Thiobacillaceae bacterium]